VVWDDHWDEDKREGGYSKPIGKYAK